MIWDLKPVEDNGDHMKHNAKDGEKDIREAFWDSDVPFYIQDKEAFITCEWIQQAVHIPEKITELSARLNQVPLYSYFVKLRSRIKLMLQEGLIEKEKLYSFGLQLTSQEDNSEEIKLGIIILGFYQNDDVMHIFRELGRFGEFTLYVLEAAKDFKNFNSFVFDLVKSTIGYAKMAALSVLQPVNDEMKDWILYHGIENEVMPNMSAIISLEKADMAHYFTDLPLNANNFQAVSGLLTYALEASNIKSFYIGLPLAFRYLDQAPILARNFIDFSAILAIYHSMTGVIKVSNPSDKDSGWTPEVEKKIESICYNLLHHERWKSVVLDAMNEPTQSVGLIISAIQELQITPPFGAFLPLLRKYPFNFDLFHFLIYDNMAVYTEDVFCFAESRWPDEVFQGALDLAQDDLKPELEPDFCLCFLLKAMLYSGVYNESFYLQCLSCRLPDCRKLAIRCLRQSRQLWSGNVVSALGSACEKEPVKNIRKSFLRLLGKKEDHPAKEQRYVNLPDPLPMPEEDDVYLFETRVAGTFYRDLFAVEGVLEENDLLYLVREPENPYDCNAILVTTDDGYVLGYIPKLENPMPAALMDSGKQLYAFLNMIDLHKSQLEISVIFKEPIDSPGSRNPFLTVIKGGKES